jgi:hypothetical protein
MPIAGDIRWKDLETKGFIHIPGFLSGAQIAACQADFRRQPVDSANRNNPVSEASASGLESLREPVEEVMKRVGSETDVRADCPLGALYFATKRGVVFPWHQDHESYFVAQNHYDYLNLYIPVVKVRPDKSNLSVIPFDVLERESPKTFRRVVRRGATLVHSLGDRLVLVQNDTGTVHVTKTDFDRIAFTPQLAEGDLLLLRGDIFHKTEDGETERVALSIRMASSQTIVRRAALANAGLAKTRTMTGNFGVYHTLFRAFDAAGKDELPLGELMRFAKECRRNPRPLVGETPQRYLFRQKVRSRVVISSIRKAATELVKNPAVWFYHKRQAKYQGRAAAPMPGHA